MKLEIQKIRLNELKSFLLSETYLQFSTVPITAERVKSYMNNPHAKSEDIVLYLGFVENKLVAFRSLFADILNSADKLIRFAWCSGNWVHPDYRRKGFSEKLLHEAYYDWDKKLMFTNYAPHSENLYLKTEWFQPIHQYTGVRAYLFPKTRKLIAKANKNKSTKIVFSIIDFFISVISSFRLLFYSEKPKNEIRFESIKTPDEQCLLFTDKNSSGSLFNQNRKKLEWIFQNPWISKSNFDIKEKYPFSSFSSSFEYQTIKIFKQNKFIGFFIFSVREGHLKTLHFNLNKNVEAEIVGFLKAYCCSNKIEILTIYNSKLARQFFKRKFPFLYLKKYGQKIYSSFEIKNEGKLHFQDGDGDVIFT